MIQSFGEKTRPMVRDDIGELVSKLYGLQVESWRELDSYEDRNYHVLVKPTICNKHITKLNTDGYTLKVLNTLESKHPELVEAQNELMSFLQQRGVHCPLPVATIDNKKWTLHEFSDNSTTGEPNKFIVRLLTFIPGKIMYDVQYTPRLLSNCGSYLAELHQTMKKFNLLKFPEKKSVWLMPNCYQILQFLPAVQNPEHKRLVEEVIAAYQKKVAPNYSKFTKGLIHGDFNEHNILLKPLPSASVDNPTYVVSGILDFADVQDSYYVFDVAIAIMYLMIQSKLIDPISVGGYILAGYTANRNLVEAEWNALKICICTRFCVSLVMGLYMYSLDRGNDYLLVTQSTGWPLLEKLWSTPDNDIYDLWKSIMMSL